MTPTQKQRKEKVELLKTAILGFGYTVHPRNPNILVKGDRRYKFSQVALRKEIKVPGRWIFLASGYIRDITLSPDRKIMGMSRSGCKPLEKQK